MCITNPLKISDFQGNLLHMLLFLQKHAFYFSILRIKEGLLHVQQPLLRGSYFDIMMGELALLFEGVTNGFARAIACDGCSSH